MHSLVDTEIHFAKGEDASTCVSQELGGCAVVVAAAASFERERVAIYAAVMLRTTSCCCNGEREFLSRACVFLEGIMHFQREICDFYETYMYIYSKIIFT